MYLMDRSQASKVLRYSEVETVKHIDKAIASITEAMGWADDAAILSDALKTLEGAKADITGEW